MFYFCQVVYSQFYFLLFYVIPSQLSILYMCYNQTGDITTVDGASLKLVDKFTNLGSSVSSTENDIDTRLTKAWTAIDSLSIIWKSDLADKMKRSFFQAAVASILLYGCTTRTLTKRLKKKLDGNYTRILRAILNMSWRQYPTRHQLYGQLPLITKTIQVRRTRHAGHCWRSKDELISDVLLWTPAYGQAKAGRPVRSYIEQLCEDTVCNPEDLPKAMNVAREGQGYPCWRHDMMMMMMMMMITVFLFLFFFSLRFLLLFFLLLFFPSFFNPYSIVLSFNRIYFLYQLLSS